MNNFISLTKTEWEITTIKTKNKRKQRKKKKQWDGSRSSCAHYDLTLALLENQASQFSAIKYCSVLLSPVQRWPRWVQCHLVFYACVSLYSWVSHSQVCKKSSWHLAMQCILSTGRELFFDHSDWWHVDRSSLKAKKDTDFDWTMKDMQIFTVNTFFKHTRQINNEWKLLLLFQLVPEYVESHSSTNWNQIDVLKSHPSTNWNEISREFSLIIICLYVICLVVASKGV